MEYFTSYLHWLRLQYIHIRLRTKNQTVDEMYFGIRFLYFAYFLSLSFSISTYGRE